MTINSGMHGAVWQALSDYLYTGEIRTNSNIYHDFTTLLQQLEMKEPTEEINNFMVRQARQGRKRLTPFNKQFHYDLPHKKRRAEAEKGDDDDDAAPEKALEKAKQQDENTAKARYVKKLPSSKLKKLRSKVEKRRARKRALQAKVKAREWNLQVIAETPADGGNIIYHDVTPKESGNPPKKTIIKQEVAKRATEALVIAPKTPGGEATHMILVKEEPFDAEMTPTDAPPSPVRPLALFAHSGESRYNEELNDALAERPTSQGTPPDPELCLDNVSHVLPPSDEFDADITDNDMNLFDHIYSRNDDSDLAADAAKESQTGSAADADVEGDDGPGTKVVAPSLDEIELPDVTEIDVTEIMQQNARHAEQQTTQDASGSESDAEAERREDTSVNIAVPSVAAEAATITLPVEAGEQVRAALEDDVLESVEATNKLQSRATTEAANDEVLETADQPPADATMEEEVSKDSNEQSSNLEEAEQRVESGLNEKQLPDGADAIPADTTDSARTAEEVASPNAAAVADVAAAAPATSKAAPTSSTATPSTSEATPTTSAGAPTTSVATPTTSEATPASSAGAPTTSTATPTKLGTAGDGKSAENSIFMQLGQNPGDPLVLIVPDNLQVDDAVLQSIASTVSKKRRQGKSQRRCVRVQGSLFLLSLQHQPTVAPHTF